MEIIRKGKSYSGKPGEIIGHAIGSVITSKGKMYMLLKELTLRVGKDGYLEELDGSKLDLRKYAIVVSQRAYNSYLKHFDFSPEALGE